MTEMKVGPNMLTRDVIHSDGVTTTKAELQEAQRIMNESGMPTVCHPAVVARALKTAREMGLLEPASPPPDRTA
jgi:hypothetical protein